MKNTGNLLLKTRKKPGISSQSKSSKTVTEISAEALQSEENKRENMLENQGKVFTRQMLLDRLWDGGIFLYLPLEEGQIIKCQKRLNFNSYTGWDKGRGCRIWQKKYSHSTIYYWKKN